MRISSFAAQIGHLFDCIPGRLSVSHCAAIGGAAAVMAFAPAAHAVPTLSSAGNVVVPATTAGIYINVVTGVTNVAPAAAPGWDINPWGSTNLAFFNPTAPTGGVYVGTATAPFSLPVGSVVGAASTFGSGAASFTSPTNPFALNSTNYVGFRFLNEANSQVHYGYAALIVGASPLIRSVGQIYFESTPGASITVVPEPSSVAMMMFGGLAVAGALARRRRASNV